MLKTSGEQKGTDLTIDFKQLQSTVRSAKLTQCHGKIVRVSGLAVESNGPLLAVGELCGIHTRWGKRMVAEVIGFNNKNLVLMPLESTEGICAGDMVTSRSGRRTMLVGSELLGRVLDGLGNPIDGKGPLQGQEQRHLEAESVSPLDRTKITQPLGLGIRSIDGLVTFGRGQRVGIFAGSGVGKSVLLGEIAKSSEAAVNVVALIGERGREVREFLEENLGPQGLAKSVVIVATSDKPAIQRMKAAFLSATIAEFFRDMGKDVLFMMDSLTRFAQAQREIGLAAGEPPTAKGYCPSVFSLMPKLIERLGCGAKGSITGILTVLAENDDMNDPVADSARSLLDGHLVLSRHLAERGYYPAVDILQSISRLMGVVASKEHNAAARKIRELYATYRDAEDLISIGAYSPGSNKKTDAAIALIDKVRAFLIQTAGDRTMFKNTVSQICEIARKWDEMIAAPKKG